MATSNSYNFTVTAESVVTDALLELGVLRDNETPSTSAPIFTNALRLLNMIIKARSNDRVFRWTYKQAFLLPTTTGNTINLDGFTSNNNIVSTYGSATLTADVAAGATSVTLSNTALPSGTEMDSLWSIGIMQDSGEILWDLVGSVSGAPTVTLTQFGGVITASTAGNIVYFYDTDDRIARPLEITQAVLVTQSDKSQKNMTIINRTDYYSRSNRTTEGDPLELFYDASLGANETSPDDITDWHGDLYIWPRFQDALKVIEFTYRRPIQDLDVSTDTLDFPQEYYLAIVKELAANLCGRYGIGNDVRMQLLNEAKMYRDLAELSEGSLKIQPDLREQY